MIDPVSANSVRPPHELYNLDAMDMGPGQVSSADQQRFEALLGTGGTSPGEGGDIRVAQAEGGDVWVNQPTAAEQQVPPPPTLGESIMNGMESLRGNWHETISEIQEATARTNFDPAELMSLQFQVQHTALVTSMVINEVTALDQEISQLLKAS